MDWGKQSMLWLSAVQRCPGNSVYEMLRRVFCCWEGKNKYVDWQNTRWWFYCCKGGERGRFHGHFFPATLSISNRMAILTLYIAIFNKHQCNMYVQANYM